MIPEETTPKMMFYLSLPSEADMPTVLADFYTQDNYEVTDPETGETSVVLDGEPYLVTDTKDYSLDVVGLIYKPTGNMLTDGDGNEYPEQVDVDGWHVNIKLARDIPNKDADDPKAVDTLRDKLEVLYETHGVIVNSPSRVFL